LISLRTGARLRMRRTCSWTLRLVLTGAILYYIFVQVALTNVVRSIASARLSYLALAVALTVAARYVAAIQMKFVTDRQGLRLSVQQIVEVNQAVKFYGLFLPGVLSGGLRWYRFSGQGSQWPQALASITFNRMLDTITLVALGLLFWMIDLPKGTALLIGTVLAALLAGLLTVHALALHEQAALRWINRLGLAGRCLLPASAQGRLGRMFESTAQSYRVCRGLAAPVASCALVGHLLGIVIFNYFALSLGITLSLFQIGWIRSVVAVLSMLPISISGLGVREGSLILLLEPYGVAAHDAVALSLLFFAHSVVSGVMGGLFELKNSLRPSRTAELAR
jgi:glycosyltransferase 2 family protein